MKLSKYRRPAKGTMYDPEFARRSHREENIAKRLAEIGYIQVPSKWYEWHSAESLLRSIQ